MYALAFPLYTEWSLYQYFPVGELEESEGRELKKRWPNIWIDSSSLALAAQINVFVCGRKI